MADGGEHFSHLALSPLMDGNFDDSEPGGFPDYLEFGRRGAASFQLYTLSQASYGVNGRTAGNFCHIGFRDFKTWMQDVLGKLPIIGEQQCPFRIKIKPAHREYPLADHP